MSKSGLLRHVSTFLFVLFLVTIPMKQETRAEEKSSPEKKDTRVGTGDYITMNFKDVDINILIKFMSDLTGRNFLVDPAVKGMVTILSPQKVTPDEAYRVFESVLEVHGFTTVSAGKVIKIIPSAAARSKGVETLIEKRKTLSEDKIVTQLVPLKHAEAVNLGKLLNPLIQKTGLIVPYAETNTLIMIDVMSNIDRLLSIIQELDIPGDEEIHVFFLEFAKAEDMAKKILGLLQEKRKRGVAGDEVKIIPDERTNALIIMASEKNRANIEKLIKTLDRKQIRPREGIHIYALENAVAEDLAKVLSEIPGKGPKDKQGKVPVLSTDIQISADKATNTLVIIAEPDEYLILEGIIKKLDRPRTMVYVEALIMEVSTTKALQLGVEWRVGNSYDGGYGEGQEGGFWVGGSKSPNSYIDNLGAGSLPEGFAVGVIGRGITLGSVTFPSLGAFIQAVRSDTDFNILSTPQILTMDNEEAVIEVGQNIPFVTRVDQGVSTTDRAIQNIEYKDVGVTLKVTPQINNQRIVRLQVEQSTKSVVNSTALEGTVLAPTTTFRTAKTKISVKDGETAVIGGLIEDRIDRSKNQTPCLGSAPALGWLFKNTSDRDQKTNLLVFLSPHIIANPEEGNVLYENKKRDMDEKSREVMDRDRQEKVRKMGYK